MPETSIPVQIDDAHLQRFAGLEPEPISNSATHPQPIENQSLSTPLVAEPTNTGLSSGESIATEEIYVTTSKRQIWASPWLKLLLAGSGIFCVVLVAGSLLNGFINVDTHTPAQAPRPAQAKQPPTAEEANGELQTKVALTTQAQELANFKQQTAKSQPPAKAKPATPIVTKPATVPAPNPVPVYPQERPVRRSQRIPVTQTVPPKTITRLQASPTTPVDPTTRWLAAANVGSYGSISSSPTNTGQTIPTQVTTDTATDSYQPLDTVTSANDSVYSPRGGIRQVPTQDNRAILTRESSDRVRRPLLSTSRAARTDNFRNNQPANYSELGRASLIVGTRVKAKLETPVAWSGSLDNSAYQNFLIKLSEPLKASNGTVIVPKKAYLVAQVNAATDTGVIQMSAVSVLKQENGQTTEIPLPKGAVLILGKRGKPLQAKVEDRDGRGNNIGRALLSGAASIAGLSNQPSYQSVFSSGGFTSTASSRDPNYLAGFGQGAAQEILQQAQDRTRQRQSLSTEPIFVLNQGTSVQVFVNQSVPL